MFGRNVQCKPMRRLSSWRKISLATWKTPSDPSVYGSLEIRAKNCLDMIERIRKISGVKLTLTHLVVKAFSLLYQKYPEINAIIRRGKLYQRETIDVFVQIFLKEEDCPDLSGTKIADADKKSVIEIAQELEAKAEKIRNNTDNNLQKTKLFFSILPTFLLSLLLKFIGFLTYDLNLDLSRFGIQKDPFGTAMITNVGMFGLELGHAPLVPFSRVPVVFSVTTLQEKVFMVDGKPSAEPVFHLGGTVDHRIIDGYMAGLAAKVLKTALEDPWKYLAPPGFAKDEYVMIS